VDFAARSPPRKVNKNSWVQIQLTRQSVLPGACRLAHSDADRVPLLPKNYKHLQLQIFVTCTITLSYKFVISYQYFWVGQFILQIF
jgi:hypothetical protein